MAKLAQNFAKYSIHARMQAKGVVEKPDIIGAIFGQTEGLLGAELDLRELQRTGRIGRIEVMVDTNKGMAYAEITIPSSLDASETSLLAASLETIDKVGPCDAEIEVVKVEDVRSQKRRFVIERAKDILKSMSDNDLPDSQRIAEIIKEAVRTREVSSYHGLSCGPDVMSSEEIIVVEGRADVITLLKNGIKNCIAIEGSKIPDAVITLTKQKTVTAFLDGDRGGELDMKKLLSVAEIDFIARADEGKEVEELTKKEIFKALRDRTPVSQYMEMLKDHKPQARESRQEDRPVDSETKTFLNTLLEELTGTKAAYLVSKDMQIISKVSISGLPEALEEFGPVFAVVMDGKISQDIADMLTKHGVQFLVAGGYKERVRTNMTVIAE
ncbi:MAG: DNA primase [Candidatus Aenigmarchaeota archaeon]|nr:DNA primase [Candidatus Aenigmarchaeota archaeon]